MRMRKMKTRCAARVFEFRCFSPAFCLSTIPVLVALDSETHLYREMLLRICYLFRNISYLKVKCGSYHLNKIAKII